MPCFEFYGIFPARPVGIRRILVVFPDHTCRYPKKSGESLSIEIAAASAAIIALTFFSRALNLPLIRILLFHCFVLLFFLLWHFPISQMGTVPVFSHFCEGLEVYQIPPLTRKGQKQKKISIGECPSWVTIGPTPCTLWQAYGSSAEIRKNL